jgi:succinylglutamic semialdehyde dehydrogenase
MGGKNSSLIWEDADLDGVLRDTLVSAYAFAGQRCTSTSRVIIHEKIVDEFVSKFHQKSKAFSIGNPLTNPFMGPLIDQGSVDRYMKFLGIALREGCEVVMRGKMLDSPALNGNYVTPSICRVKDNSYDAVKKSVYQQNEVMGPNLSVLTTSDLDHAIALTNGTQYGLVSSVYTKDRAVFEKAADELKFGSIHWNRPTILGSPRLPTLGLKKSGNHMPAGSFSPRFCAYPVSSIEGETPIVGNPRQIFPEKI